MDTTGCALVVGAGGGIGTEAALALVANGASAIVCADIDLKAAETTKDKCESMDRGGLPPVKAYALQVDVTNESSVAGLVDSAHQTLGRLDYFVNASGFGNPGQINLDATEFENYKAMDAVHNHANFLLLQYVLKKMHTQELKPVAMPSRSRRPQDHPRFLSRGVICIVASLASVGGYQGVGPYVSAKHAVVGLVRTAALENGAKGIRVNAVSPSYVSGPMIDTYLEAAPDTKKVMLSDLPLGRLADPTEVADTVTFLCSAHSSYINGVNMVIDGGASVALARGQY